MTQDPGVRPGDPRVLGARHRAAGPGGAEGTFFSLWAATAQAVDLCLFDDAGRETRHRLHGPTDGVWHGFAPGVRPGQRYGYRVHGRWDPYTGARFNAAKLLLDPYARAVDGEFPDGPGGLPPEVYGHVRDWPRQDAADTVRDERDSAPFLPKGVVVADPPATAGDDDRPRTPWADTVIYELHVRGFTMRHPHVPPELRGTYAGLAHPAVTGHLTRLGVTAVELLPVQQFAHDDHVLRRGLRNHWGYDPVAPLAPHAGYSSAGTRGEQVAEFRAMVRALHRAGLEVILDVVHNHTAEGDERGPTYSLRGIDNAAYYRLADDPRRYADVTGCGNTVAAARPPALRLVTDALRYWVTEMGVDGFRFDLASALLRSPHPGRHEPDPLSPLLAAIGQDPVLRDVKLIAEPWDTGADGYLAGSFPPPWSEWNDRFRDTVRDFWRGALPDVRDLAYRLSGSSDRYARPGRHPRAAVNFVTAHDGFTLRDLVSYDRKHNEANGEDGRDGADVNRSWNCGAEGDTADPRVAALRRRQARNLLATLLLATGVPMLTAGDELGRTQRGNNNAYCQDNELSWLDWSPAADPAGRSLLALATRLIRLRRATPALRRTTFFTGRPGPDGLPDVAWFRPGGGQLTEADWYAPSRTLGVYLRGEGGAPALMLLLHAGEEPLDFHLPGPPWAHGWELLADTARDDQDDAPATAHPAGAPLPLPARSLLVLRARPATP